jgi:phytoene dehydrogenase-like protein
MISALVALFRELGGELRCGIAVEKIDMDRGIAVGVMADGARIASRQGIIANLTPTALFEKLARDAPASAVNKARRYRYGPGTMMLHLALSDLPNWRSRAARDYFYVHIAPSLADMQQAYCDARTGRLPDEPALVVAQPTIVDPSRAPAGRHVLSVQVRAVPGGADWQHVKPAYADRVIDLLESNAPGLRSRILACHVISPADMERDNPNLVGGDSVSGSHHLSQNLVNRPFFGWSRYRTPIRNLYLCGAATWPGAGSGAGSGWILGHMLVAGNR